MNLNRSVKLETLDTAYVNLAALIRYLRGKNFTGRLHVSLQEYEADVFLYGAAAPSVWESGHPNSQGAQNEGALDRLLVRAREPGGIITLYEDVADEPPQSSPAEQQAELRAQLESSQPEPPAENLERNNVLVAGAELIGAVERAVQSTGIQFADVFREARIEVGDDYPFLDPTLGGFEYTGGAVIVRGKPSRAAFVNGLSGCLRRVVEKLASERPGGERFRERVAVELAIAARRQTNALADFTGQLDRIAGTKVL
jgi:hypothetical protein